MCAPKGAEPVKNYLLKARFDNPHYKVYVYTQMEVYDEDEYRAG